ncbi:MAG: hypothetical protein IT328_15555 [Caldilineaceae bacterium]|nr:hypothetical protein [Caldilineaceae bacterium]
MLRTSLRPFYLLGTLIAVLLAITAGAGVLMDGLYRPFLDEPLVAFQFFQDLLSLLFAPLLVMVMVWTDRGSLRAFVIWNGLLVYAAYYYAFYCFGFVYTLYYPLYLAVMGLATFSLVGLSSNVDLQFFRARVSERMPVRLVSGVLGMTVLFVPIWLSMMFQGIRTGQVGTTDLVFVLDLAFLIPACVFAAVQIWRRRPVGYLFSGPLLFKATVSGILLMGGEFLKMQRGLPPALDQLAMYLFLATVGLVGLVLYLRNLGDVPEQKNMRAATRSLKRQGRLA